MSPWPILCALSTLCSVFTFISWVCSLMDPLLLLFLVILSVFSLLLSLVCWWRDVIRESTLLGFHTKEVCAGLYIGFSMFLLSEIMFFFSFFFSYFSTALSPDPAVGMSWPPTGVQPVSFLGVPFGNTILLLASGVSLTWAHHSILCGSGEQFSLSMVFTVSLAVVFLSLQILEYKEMSFTFSDSVFGSLFFIMTGFHGIHVMVGLFFLLVSMSRGVGKSFSSGHHLGFELSAWYWHFVDVVWLFLFVVIYWWGS